MAGGCRDRSLERVRGRARGAHPGVNNNVSGEGGYVAAGGYNTVSGEGAVVDGGFDSTASGTSATIPGGYVNSAGGTYSFAAGARASAAQTNTASTVGAQLAAGSGTWASLSDRNAKTNIAPVDDATVLDRVASLPISRWSYKSERRVRHVGPMAQDFYAAFKVGADDKHITSIDEDGVALAAIKALHAENGRAQRAIRTLRALREPLRICTIG